jgi:fibro-slime domain-containing protein
MQTHTMQPAQRGILHFRYAITKTSLIKSAIGSLIFTLIFAAGLFPLPAQTQDQTIMVKVIYYDYDIVKAPRNPNFEIVANVVATGMIQDTLSSERKPLFLEDIVKNTRIEEWFRPSGATTYDTSAHFIYDKDYGDWKWTNLVNNAQPDEWVSKTYSDSNAMRNIVIYDSLPFTAVSGKDGVYQYSNQAFFPINDRGYGNQPNTVDLLGKNFGFAMEIHREFDYLGGEFFEFEGDDDLWVFINGTLALDLGGIHAATKGNFYLDSLATKLKIEKGKPYKIEIFYAERHIVASDIMITTNIIRPKPNVLRVFPRDTSIVAGSTIKIRSQIRDQRDQVMTALLDSIKWTILPPKRSGDTILDQKKILTPDSVSIISFTATKAYDTVKVEASLVDPNNKNKVYRDTARVYIMAGALYNYVFEDEKGKVLPDSITLYADPTKGPVDQNIVAAGYDSLGNKLPDILSVWAKNGTLHDLKTTQGTRIFYSASDAKNREKGIIAAFAVIDPTKSDWVSVTIMVDAVISKAITRDYNGNGYLDAIEVHFTESITWPIDLKSTSVAITDQKNGTPIAFSIKNVTLKNAVPANGLSDSVFIFNLNELSSGDFKDLPETDWTPTITLKDLPGTENKAYTTTDGAGPVIWRAYLKTAVYGDHKKDKVSITFSENVTDAAGGPVFSSTILPTELLHVMKRDPSTGGFTPADDMLDPVGNDAITGFSNVLSDSAEFLMTNGKVLNGNYYFSIDSTKNLIKDVCIPSNYPNFNNQFVRPLVTGWVGNITIGPNPMTPVMNHYEEQLTNHYPPEEAINWTLQEGGTVMLVDIALSDSFKVNPCLFKVKAVLFIYDAIGNLVYQRENRDNILTPNFCAGWVPGEIKTLALYWNGIVDDDKQKGTSNRKASPGIYRIVVAISGDGEGIPKYTGNIGVTR